MRISFLLLSLMTFSMPLPSHAQPISHQSYKFTYAKPLGAGIGGTLACIWLLYNAPGKTVREKIIWLNGHRLAAGILIFCATLTGGIIAQRIMGSAIPKPEQPAQSFQSSESNIAPARPATTSAMPPTPSEPSTMKLATQHPPTDPEQLLQEIGKLFTIPEEDFPPSRPTTCPTKPWQSWKETDDEVYKEFGREIFREDGNIMLM